MNPYGFNKALAVLPAYLQCDMDRGYLKTVKAEIVRCCSGVVDLKNVPNVDRGYFFGVPIKSHEQRSSWSVQCLQKS